MQPNGNLRRPGSGLRRAADDTKNSHTEGTTSSMRDAVSQANIVAEESLQVRVKDGKEPGGASRASRSNRRLGQLFRDPSPSINATVNSVVNKNQQLLRPLSSLLARRPGSKSGSRKNNHADASDALNDGNHADVNIDDQELNQLEQSLSTTVAANNKASNAVESAGAVRGGRRTLGVSEEAVRAFGHDDGSTTPEIPTLHDVSLRVHCTIYQHSDGHDHGRWR
jgi:hypothetical protein